MTEDLRLTNLDAAAWKAVINGAIKKRHTRHEYNRAPAPEGILFFELYSGIGHGLGEPSRFDAFHLNDVPSKGLRRTAYEVKVSRSDFLREVRTPLKRRAALRFSNFFYFVTPPGVAHAEEVPVECGLIEVDEAGRAKVVVTAPYRDSMPPSWLFFTAVARRAKEEQKNVAH